MEYVLLLGNRIGVTKLLDRMPDLGVPYPVAGKIVLGILAAHICFRLVRGAVRKVRTG